MPCLVIKFIVVAAKNIKKKCEKNKYLDKLLKVYKDLQTKCNGGWWKKPSEYNGSYCSCSFSKCLLQAIFRDKVLS